ncbi:baseplate J/gp47 family protein [Rhodopseudomonas sp. BR0G17]|uniref:baseplate J/gp47 family protein n=1 Tax=Rhodopseudomonas sp. BR0G17 TaxID=2269368 RepID=UPI00202BD965|nr:baseplate J/gp47 family protein [Rhodopseudomonas sp. BR0G17]NEW96651.1 hypothetical protein [Rhodopseudomonas sp. BR0G17]
MFAIPSLPDLLTYARQRFRIFLPGSDAWLWPNNIGPTAKVVAGFAHEVFGFADYIQKQKFALTADSENLDLHGEEFGMARAPAAPARGFVDVASTIAVTILPAAVMARADGVQYRALAGASLLGAGSVSVEVVAVTDGIAGNALAGTGLVLASGFVADDLDQITATVGADGVVGGSDVEDDESFRERILFRKRNPPSGGSPADYVGWCRAMSGVTRVFVERRFAGPGTVRVFPLMDDLYADGIPPSAEIGRISDNLDPLAPAAANYTVAAASRKVIDITVSNLVPDTADMREAVISELRAMFRRQSRVSGGDAYRPALPYLAWPETFSRSWIWQTIANSTGEERHIVVSPAADVPLDPGAIATLGAVTFI